MEGAMQAAEAIGRRATDMQDVLSGAKIPPRGQPLAGVTASAVARCSSIADQIVALSAEMASQLRVYESSARRGQRLAALRADAKSAATAKKGPEESADSADSGEVEDEWDTEWDNDL